eukprot:6174577-Pleurochrysis_carterae.AAC.1
MSNKKKRQESDKGVEEQSSEPSFEKQTQFFTGGPDSEGLTRESPVSRDFNMRELCPKGYSLGGPFLGGPFSGDPCLEGPFSGFWEAHFLGSMDARAHLRPWRRAARAVCGVRVRRRALRSVSQALHEDAAPASAVRGRKGGIIPERVHASLLFK